MELSSQVSSFANVILKSENISKVDENDNLLQEVEQNCQTNLEIVNFPADYTSIRSVPSMVLPALHEKPSAHSLREFVDCLKNIAKDELQELIKKNKTNRKKSKGRLLSDDIDFVNTDTYKRYVLKNWFKELSDDSDATVDSQHNGYFDSAIGKFFVNTGLSLVKEFVDNEDMIKQTKKVVATRSQRYKKAKLEIAAKVNVRMKQKANPFTFEQKKCSYCNFKTESILVMDNHFKYLGYETEMLCGYCPYHTYDQNKLVFHRMFIHKIHKKSYSNDLVYQCPTCLFDSEEKIMFEDHRITCEKDFNPQCNLAPPGNWLPPAHGLR